jgi:hypothetical protein
MDRHKAVLRNQPHSAWSKKSGFEWDLAHGYLQARLLALCYPQEVEEAVLATLGNSQSTTEDVIFCTKVLGVLASQARPSSEAALLRVIESTKDETVIATALDCLMSHDRQGRYRAIYWSKCAEGVLRAFEFGPYWLDQQTKQTLTQIYERENTPSSPDFYSREALKRMAILESPERSSKLDRLVGDSWAEQKSDDAQWQERWALRVVQITPSPETIGILRRRLERDESEAAGGVLGPLGPTQSGYMFATRDINFDEALLAYVALGGTPNETETIRLRYYGYLGDPKERLEALLAEDQPSKR